MKKIFPLLPLLALVLSGCLITIKGPSDSDGGVFRSQNFGDEWSQVTMVYRVDELEKNFRNVDVMSMAIDPTDPQAIYIGTALEGLYYTYNGGQAWQQALPKAGQINDIAISPKNRCTVYLAISNRVYKTTDCSRHWNYQLIESRFEETDQITSLAIDSFNDRIIYSGTAGKALYRSEDGGYSWHVVRYFDSRISKILIDPSDTNTIYVATSNNGIYKTSDQGETWQELFGEEFRKENKGVEAYRSLVMNDGNSQDLLYASQAGLIRTADGGQTWQQLKLLTPAKEAIIYSLAIDPSDQNKIYYGSTNTLYRSEDGGANWITRSLPTARAPKFLFVNPENTQVIYLGAKTIKQ